MNKYIPTISAVLLALLIASYWFTPVFDELVIEKSLKRFCAGVKEDFKGMEYSNEYLCLFMDDSEEQNE